MEICVIGETDSVMGFAALGLRVRTASDISSAKNILKEEKKNSAIIYITENLAKDMEHEIQKLHEQITPAIVLIPSHKGSLGIGISAVKKSVERAVGADILFGGEEKQKWHQEG